MIIKLINICNRYMNKLIEVQKTFKKIIDEYATNYSFNLEIRKSFNELNTLFFDILKKEVNGINVTIEKRNEFDILNGILVSVSGKLNKRDSYDFEVKYQRIIAKRDQLVQILKSNNFKYPTEKVKDPLKIERTMF